MKARLVRLAGAGVVVLALWLVTSATPRDACGQGGCACCGCPPGQTTTCCQCSVYPAVANCCCAVPTPPPLPTATPGGPAPTPAPTPTPTPAPPCVPPVIVRMCTSAGCSSGLKPVEIRADCEGNILAVVPLGSCGSLFCAAPTPAPPGDVGPCDPLTAGLGWGVFNCGGEYDLSATAYIPGSTVNRRPTPKGMVNVPNTLELVQPASGAIGWSAYALRWPASVPAPDHEDATPFQTIKDFRFGLRWRQAPGLLPYWQLGDGGTAAGWEITHTYSKSSYGQPCLRDGLEAYCISTSTCWLLDGVTEWYAWECTRWEHECVWHNCNDDRTPHQWEWLCPYPGCYSGINHQPWMSGHPDWQRVQVCTYYDWVHHEVWEPIDLRKLGRSTEYYTFTSLSDRLPVIEAQSVIDDPRP